jgi:hypothetical protein
MVLGQALVESGEVDEGIAAMRRAARSWLRADTGRKDSSATTWPDRGIVGEARQLLDELWRCAEPLTCSGWQSRRSTPD